MTYLIRKNSRGDHAHIWEGLDTRCGLMRTNERLARYVLTDDLKGYFLCPKCQTEKRLAGDSKASIELPNPWTEES